MTPMQSFGYAAAAVNAMGGRDAGKWCLLAVMNVLAAAAVGVWADRGGDAEYEREQGGGW